MSAAEGETVRDEIRSASAPTSTLAHILSSVIDDLQRLIRGEIALARAEIQQKISRASEALIYIGIGAVLGLCGLLIFLIAMALALAMVIPFPAAFFVVSLLVFGIAGWLAWDGIQRLKHLDLTPRRTAANLNADARMVKESFSADAPADGHLTAKERV